MPLSTLLAPLAPVCDTLRPYTQQIPAELVTRVSNSVLGPGHAACVRRLVIDLALVPQTPAQEEQLLACLKQLASAAISTGMITALAVLKLPTILRLLQLGRSGGLNFASVLLELVGQMLLLAFSMRSGFPFSTYGELGFLLVQNVVLICLLLRYTGHGFLGAGVVVLALAAMAHALLSDQRVPFENLVFLQRFVTVPLGIVAKLPQIASNFRSKLDGALLAVALLLQAVGAVARVFTTYAAGLEGAGVVVLGYVLLLVLNSVLLGQVLYYGKGRTKGRTVGTPGKYGVRGGRSHVKGGRSQARL